MGTKNDQLCSQCPQKDRCQEVYAAMGKSAAPNVAWAVFWAFLAPIGLFIGLLWALERWLPDFETARLRTSVIFIIGFGVTAAVMWTIKMVKGKMMRHQ